MKLFLIDNDKITKYKIPDRVDDSFIISYSNEMIKDVLITLIGIDNKWHIQSNGTANVVINNIVQDTIHIKLYSRYQIKIIGNPNLIDLYFLPTAESLFKLGFENLPSFSVGRNQNCNIYYDSNYLADVQAMFKPVNDEWWISCVNNDEYKVFVNDIRVTIKKLNFGDIIFIGGIKIVWMKKFICVNNPENKLKIGGLTSLAAEKQDNVELLPVSDEDKIIELYNPDDYFVPYPAIREKIEEKEFIIDAPPGSEKQDAMPWILTMGSTIMMTSSAFIMAYNVGYGLYTNNNIWRIIPQALMCVSMLIGSLLLPRLASRYQKKQREKREKLRNEKYNEYLDKKRREIDIYVKNELQILNDTYLGFDACMQALEKRNDNFWRFQIDDEAFLSLNLGIGKVKSNVIINAPEEHFTLDLDELLERVYKIKKEFEYIDNAPITVSLKEFSLTAFISNKPNENFLNDLLAQLIILQSSLDLKIVILTSEIKSKKWEFMKYVPHIFSDDKSIRFFATNTDDAKMISNYLEEELKARKENPEIKQPFYLVITDEYKMYKSIQIVDELVNKDLGDFNFSFVLLEKSIKQVPITVKAFVEYTDVDGVVIERQHGLNSQAIFKINQSNTNIDLMKIALKLADVPVTSKDGPSVLPTSLNFLDMFGVSRIEQLNILNRWQSNNPVVSLDTVVGVHKNGDKFTLDLHEKFHGPHGLIAGSTGSGKSEFIITYILSMIINYHPYEVQFVLIDYKGGGLTGAFENKETGVKIPHLAGTITNLDASEMNRSLVSIQSELRRRQRIFNATRERLNESTIDIYKYQKLYREGVVDRPLAHLFIICDEFAELKQQRPEFMQQLISTSRIGRSLGIHLILATQKPSGVVNDQIWSNSKFKVCLKVQDRSDSMEMLKRPEAASIKEAGRFYLQVGYDDYFDIGQSGWSGAKYIPSDRIITKVDESLNYINNVGYTIKSIKDIDEEYERNKKDYGDQLSNVVKYIYNIGNKENVVADKMWLDPIPAIIFDTDLKQKYGYKPEPYHINPVIGEFDDPVNQIQELLNIDLSKKGNLLLYGSTGSGKENFLINLIHSIVVEHTPDEANIYVLDCGSESLKILNNLPHVGEILTSADETKMVDLFNFIGEEIERRKEIFADYAGSYNDYIQNSGSKLPLMVVVINNYDNFSENYNKLSEAVTPLFRDGARYGVVFVVSVVSPNAIRSRVVQYFENKVCLQLSDGDYRSVINAPRGLAPANIFGRGLVEIDSESYEFQTSTFAERKDYSNYIRKLSATLNQAYTSKAPKIPTIPDIVDVDMLMENIKSPTLLPIGYNLHNKAVNYFDFTIKGIVPVIAMDIDNIKMGFIYAIIQMLNAQANAVVKVMDFVRAYQKSVDGIYAIKDNYEQEIMKMCDEITSSGDNVESYYIILGMSNLKSKVSDEVYNKVISIFNDIDDYPKTHFIIVDVYNGIKSVMMDSWYQSKVGKTNGIWLGDNIGSQMVFDLPNLTMDERRESFPYMAYAIVRGKHTLIKHVVKPEVNDEE